MGEINESHYQRASIKASVLCALLGLLTASAIAAILYALVGVGLHQILINPWFRGPIAVAVIALFAAAVSFGLIAGNLIYRFGLHSYATPIIGIVLAWTCLLVSAVSGASVSFVNEPHEPQAFTDYVIRPVFGIIVVGAFPALLFGLIYLTMVRSELSEMENRKE